MIFGMVVMMGVMMGGMGMMYGMGDNMKYVDFGWHIFHAKFCDFNSIGKI